MANDSMIFFTVCAFIVCACQARRIIERPKIEIHKLYRITDDLKENVDDIWETILTSGIHVQSYENNTIIGILVALREDYMTLKHHLETLDIEQARLDESCKDELQTINKVLNERKNKTENELEAQSVINENLNKTLYDLIAKQTKLELENEALKLVLTEMQNHDEKMKVELTLLQDVIVSLSETTQTPPTTAATTTTTTTPVTYICEEGWEKFDGHCYLRVLEKKTWDAASAFCESRNAYLLEITTDAELTFVGELTRVIYNDKFWIGATDREHEGTYVYQHSQQLVPDKYWFKTEPDNYNGAQHCAAMNSHYGNLELYDNGCNWNRYFVCEVP